MNQEKFDSELEFHKRSIGLLTSQWGTDKVKKLIVPAILSGEELALAYSKCKCESCKRTDDLQFHHLINRQYLKFDKKYHIQRVYWANIMILCKKCHAEIENRSNGENDGIGVLSQKKIDKIKKMYGIT